MHSDDQPGARVQVWGAAINENPSRAAILAEGLVNTRINAYGITPHGTVLESIGTGASVPGGVGFWGGGAGFGTRGTPIAKISNNANALFFDAWFETHNDTFGTLTGNAGNIAILSSHYYHCKNAVCGTPVLTLNNFSGNFLWGPGKFADYGEGRQGPITVKSPNSNTNFLAYGILFQRQSSYWSADPGGQVYLKDAYYQDPSGALSRIADKGGTPSDAFLRSVFNLPRSYDVTQNIALPCGVTDVIVEKVMLQTMLNGVHVKSACTTSCPTPTPTPTPMPTPTPTTPFVNLSASPTSVAYGGSSTLNWSSGNVTSCSASGGWSGSKTTSGTQTITNLTSTATYTLTCTGANGSASQSVTVTVAAPTPIPTPTPPPAVVSEGVFQFNNVYSGKVLQIPNSSMLSGTQADQWTNTGGNHQKWEIKSAPHSGYYTLKNITAICSSPLQTPHWAVRSYSRPQAAAWTSIGVSSPAAVACTK